MSTSLREFLMEKATEYAAESEQNRGVVEEWQAAVEKLFTQLEGWLAAADPEGIIRRERSQIEVTEPGLGRYASHRASSHCWLAWLEPKLWLP